jgi:hypothetical protein
MCELTEAFLNAVYDVLVNKGGASENNRFTFIYIHLHDDYPCREFRFCGKFGMGGKYWVDRNKISAYAEDIYPEMQLLMDEINDDLSKLTKDN